MRLLSRILWMVLVVLILITAWLAWKHADLLSVGIDLAAVLLAIWVLMRERHRHVVKVFDEREW